MNTFRLIIAAIFILAGLLVFISGVIGIFRIKYALNRLHSAAMLDSLGLLLITTGLIIIKGFSFNSLKLLLILGLFWIASPVCSHLLTALEVSTNPDLKDNCEIIDISEFEELKKQGKM
jgi:multicomponent Na+:H+ antiporter subunit G